MSISPDGLFQYGGSPVASAAYTNPWTTAYFVDGTNGTAGAGGKSPDDPTATISQAITLATAGDVIYVRQLLPIQSDMTDPTAYAENLVIPVAKHTLSIIGTGNNPHNPFYCQVKPSASGYGVEIKAVSTTIENLDFNRGSATTGVIFFSGDNGTTDMGWGSLISNCHIRNANGLANAGVKFEAGSYNTIYNCDFEACHTGVNLSSGGTFPIRSPRIERCRFKASNASAVGGDNIWGAGAANILYEIEILDCYFERVPTGSFIDLSGANHYGIISNCHFGDDDVSCTTSGANINKPTTVFVTGCYDDSGTMIATT
ncbi:MAG: hypothetical protein V3V81_08165 [Candidatus Bathyarchaeia archaeon]